MRLQTVVERIQVEDSLGRSPRYICRCAACTAYLEAIEDEMGVNEGPEDSEYM